MQLKYADVGKSTKNEGNLIKTKPYYGKCENCPFFVNLLTIVSRSKETKVHLIKHQRIFPSLFKVL